MILNKVAPHFYHRLSHNLNTVAQTWLFSVITIHGRGLPYSSLLWSAHRCDIAQRQRDLYCVLGIVYPIPPACSPCYIGKTAGCVNLLLMEHKINVKNKPQKSIGYARDHMRTVSFTLGRDSYSVKRGTMWRVLLKKPIVLEWASCDVV